MVIHQYYKKPLTYILHIYMPYILNNNSSINLGSLLPICHGHIWILWGRRHKVTKDTFNVKVKITHQYLK